MARSPRRIQARKEGTCRGEDEADGNRPPIEIECQPNTDVAHDRQLTQKQHSAIAQSQTQSASSRREEKAFSDQLARDAESSTADREPKRHLLFAHRRPAREQAGHVRARDEQNDERESQEHERTRCRRSPLLESSFECRLHHQSVVAIGIRVRLLEATRDRGDLLSGLFDRNAWLESAAYAKTSDVAEFEQVR